MPRSPPHTDSREPAHHGPPQPDILDCRVRRDAPWLRLWGDAEAESSRYIYSQRVSLPFAGIGGPDRAMMEAGWRYEPVNVIERRLVACNLLRKLHGRQVASPRDFRSVNPDDIMSCEGLIGGAPCVSFSTLGKLGGLNDAHGDLFIEQLKMVKALAGRVVRPLRWMLLENVWAITFQRQGSSAWDAIQAWWCKEMPGWTPVQLWKLDAKDCGLPQARVRCFMVAFDRRFADVVGGLDCMFVRRFDDRSCVLGGPYRCLISPSCCVAGLGASTGLSITRHWRLSRVVQGNMCM